MNTNKAKHTPGPWKITVTPDGNYRVFCDSLIEGTIADIREDEETRAKANAVLIAAAPELLAALEQCADMLERVTYMKDFPELLNARAAIAKAKSE